MFIAVDGAQRTPLSYKNLDCRNFYQRVLKIFFHSSKQNIWSFKNGFFVELDRAG